MNTVHVNGRFLTQPITGVQRVARELLQAVDRRLVSAAAKAPPWVLWCPPHATPLPLQHVQVRQAGARGLHPHLWEQAVLPWAARGARLLSLAGSSPWLPRGQVCSIHDAAVFDHPHAYTPAFSAWYRALFRRQALQAARLLTVSAFSQARLAASLGVAATRIGVVPNGADHLSRVQADTSILDLHGLRGRRFLLAVGSANPTKNLDRLRQAFARLPADDELSLVIVGGVNARVFAAGAVPGLSARVLHTGPLGDAPLKALYQHALALVFPSLYEGFGRPPLEAMACGCPVLAAHAASLPEVCGDAALYFDPLSVGDMAAALQRMVGDACLLYTSPSPRDS